MKDMNIIKLDNVGISIDYDEKKYEKSASVSKKLNILFIGTLIILVGFVLYDMFLCFHFGKIYKQQVIIK